MGNRWRTRSAIFAVIAQWLALVLGISGYLVLDYEYQASTAMAPGNPMAVIMLVSAFVAGVLAAVFALVAAFKDRGRIRAGAVLLLFIPLAMVGYLVWATRSTMTGSDIWAPLTLIGCTLVLIVATILIALPEHLGVD